YCRGRQNTGAGKRDGMGAPRGVVRYRKSRGARAGSGRSERDGDGAVGTRRQTSPAGIRLIEVTRVGAAECNTGDRQAGVAAVCQSNTLAWTRGVQSLTCEG